MGNGVQEGKGHFSRLGLLVGGKVPPSELLPHKPHNVNQQGVASAASRSAASWRRNWSNLETEKINTFVVTNKETQEQELGSILTGLTSGKVHLQTMGPDSSPTGSFLPPEDAEALERRD